VEFQRGNILIGKYIKLESMTQKYGKAKILPLSVHHHQSSLTSDKSLQAARATAVSLEKNRAYIITVTRI
jgi:hypothetical protein